MERSERAIAVLGRHLRPYLNWEVAAYVFLFAVSLVMRLWDLGARGVSHDESLHGIYSWYLANGNGYHHNPMMHGPFLFHGTAVNFLVFGDSDVTMRLLPAVFGAVLVVLPYFLRRQLGRWGSLCVAVLLAFSPGLLYFSRYARNDIFIAMWSLLLLIFMWRFFEARKARYLYLGAAVLSLSFCTKETSYITAATFALLLFVATARELVGRARKRFDLKDLSASAEYFVLIATLALPLYSAFIQIVPGVDLPSGLHWLKVLVVIVLFVICAAIGIRWNWRRWLWCALIFYGAFALLYTSFFTNPSGFASGLWNSVDYWVEQQDVARGGQPWFYYLAILPIYEFLPLLFGSVGAIYYAIKGSLFSRFLIGWGLLSVVLYSYSAEKMPWNYLHIALPAIVLGGMFIVRLLQAFDWEGAKAWAVRGATILVLLLLFPFTVYGAVQASYDKSDDTPQMLVYAGISYDVPAAAAEIDELAEQRGEGEEMSITVDTPFTWPWYWYLRDYKRVGYDNLASIKEPPNGTVVLVELSHESAVQPYLEGYSEQRRFRELLWFPEEYRDFDLGWWWRYFLHRETRGPYWSSEGISYFPAGSP